MSHCTVFFGFLFDLLAAETRVQLAWIARLYLKSKRRSDLLYSDKLLSFACRRVLVLAAEFPIWFFVMVARWEEREDV